MTKKMIKELLGDCYINLNDTKKGISNERFYRAIDKFINRPLSSRMFFGCDSFVNNWAVGTNLKKFLEMNPDVHVFNSHYLIEQQALWSYNYRYVAICEKDNVKRVLLYYYQSGTVFLDEIYESLPYAYMRALYIGIVYDIVDVKMRFRNIKESFQMVDDIKHKCFYSDNGRSCCINRFTIENVDKNNLIINVKEKTTKISLEDMKHKTSSRTYSLYGFTSIRDFINKYRNFQPIDGIGDELRENTNTLIKKSLNRRSREILALKKKVPDMKII